MRYRYPIVFAVLAWGLSAVPWGSAQSIRGRKIQTSGELWTQYASRYMFRGTDRLLDDPALRGHFETTLHDVLDPGDLVLGVWGSTDTEGGLADTRDELRYYYRLQNESRDRNLYFRVGMTYFDFKGDRDLFDDTNDTDVFESWLGVQFLKTLFQPELQVYYDRPVSSGGPGKGMYLGLSGTYRLPVGKTANRLGFQSLDIKAAGWYQDGVFDFDPGASIEGAIELPIELWGLEIRPGLHGSHLFDDPDDTNYSDDRDEWWFTVATIYRFGHHAKREKTKDPFGVSAEDLFRGLEMPGIRRSQ